MTAWFRDFRYGAWMIVKRPGTSATAILALGLGIGLTTVMFSIVQGALLRGLPFDEGDRILLLQRVNITRPGQRLSVPVDDYLDWRDRQQSFEDLGASAPATIVINDPAGFPERVRAAQISTNALSILRVRPVLGRDFGPADGEPGAAAVALIGHQIWSTRYHGDPSVVGRTIDVGGTPTTIVGVLPDGFRFPQSQDLWRPITLQRAATRGRGQTLRVFGRLKPGVSARQASAEIAGLARQLAETYPENKDLTATAGPYVLREIGDEVVSTLFTMLGAVFGVMLIACVNVTNLQLARAAERTKEIAVRAALGSGRWRIVRQLLAEGLLLSAAGAALGLGIAVAGTGAFMRAIVDTDPPFWIDVRVDPTVVLFVGGITVAAAVVSSVLPGWRVARSDTNAVLKDDSRGATSVRMGLFTRSLVIIEVAASCILLVVSGLMIRSIMATSRVDYPFATKDVFYAQVSLDPGDRDEAGRVLQIEDLEARLSRLPGVRAASLSTGVPGTGSGGGPLDIEGQAYASDDERPQAGRIALTPAFFDVARVRPLAGRVFTAADRLGAEPVVLVDEVFARRYLADGATIGRRLRLGDDKQPWRTVVGIVPSLAGQSQGGQVGAMVFQPLTQTPSTFLYVLASTSGDPLALTAPVRTTVLEVSDKSPVSTPNTLASELWRRGWAFRVFGGLFLMFGLAALFLAAAGLYGVMAFSVRRRTPELGVRMALGATRGGMLRMVLWQGFWRVGLGVLLGLVPGWYLGTLMQALLANVDPADPAVLGTTAATLLAAGLLASLTPALRAASVDPLTALRQD
ncbi:MAG: ADOP family duplicated permease [Vicinamibacterales bacterium]